MSSNMRSVPNQGPNPVVKGENGVCSSSHPLVTDTMMDVLKDGGNAFDAAVAGSLIQATVETHLTNHGGSVVGLYYDASTGETHQLTSTGTLVPGMRRHNPLPEELGKAVCCIPGFMPGLGALHERFASKTWSELCQPAIAAARDGYPMYSFQYALLHEQLPSRTYFPAGRELLTPDGFIAPVGELFRNPALADTLEALAEEGPQYFTEGAWAQHFVEEGNRLGWRVTMEHMKDAVPPRWSEPLEYSHGKDNIIQLAPPEQAGVFTRFVLGVLKEMDLTSRGHYSESAESLYLFSHVLRWVAWEMGMLQDPELFSVPTETWGSEEHHRAVADIILNSMPKIDLTEHVELIAGDAAMASQGREAAESDSCELSIADSEGNWVQMLHSCQGGGIPGAVVDGVPMTGTSAQSTLGAGITGWLTGNGRQKCIIGSTLVMRDGKPRLALGTPGRPNITVPQVLSSILDYGMEPHEAAVFPRMYPLAEDYSLEIENRIPDSVIEDITRMGIQIKPLGTFNWHMGSFQMCWRDSGTGMLYSNTDPRRTGKSAAF